MEQKQTSEPKLISQQEVIERILPRLNSSRKGSLEHQRLSSILWKVRHMKTYPIPSEER